MELSLTFGAVGDFIAVCSLIKEIVTALDHTRGSASEFRDLRSQLEILATTVQEAESLFNHASQHNVLFGLRSVALQTTTQIRNSIDRFKNHVAKFGPSLSTGGSGNRVRDTGRKVQWRFKKGDVEKFQGELATYSSTLQILLQIASMFVTYLPYYLNTLYNTLFGQEADPMLLSDI